MLTFGVTSLWFIVAWPDFAHPLFLTICRDDTRLGMNGLRWPVTIVSFDSAIAGTQGA